MSDVDPAVGRAPVRPAPRAGRGGMRRRDAVLGGLVIAGALFGTTRAPWLHASVPDLAGGSTAVAVGGDQAAPAVVALAVVALATSLATAISSSLVRFVTGPVLVLCGLGAGASALLVRTEPDAHATSAVAAATGLLGSGAQVTLTPWSLVALAPSALLVVLGVLVLWRGRGWQRSRRYDRDARPAGSARAAEASTATATGRPGSGTPTQGPGSVSAPADHLPGEAVDPDSAPDRASAHDAVPDDDADGAAEADEDLLEDPSAAWDALSRGEDPTARGEGPDRAR